jgi:Meiotically up-regulated gene 113
MGSVYIAKCQGYYKIGYTGGDPRKRIAELQTGNPFPVEYMGSISGSLEVEDALHERFAHKHVRGEWFALNDADLRDILSVKDPEFELRLAKLSKMLGKLSHKQQTELYRELLQIRKEFG